MAPVVLAVHHWSDSWTVAAQFRAIHESERADSSIMRRFIEANRFGWTPAIKLRRLMREEQR